MRQPQIAGDRFKPVQHSLRRRPTMASLSARRDRPVAAGLLHDPPEDLIVELRAVAPGPCRRAMRPRPRSGPQFNANSRAFRLAKLYVALALDRLSTISGVDAPMTT